MPENIYDEKVADVTVTTTVTAQIRRSAFNYENGAPYEHYDWIAEGGEESREYFDTAEEAETDFRRWVEQR